MGWMIIQTSQLDFVLDFLIEKLTGASPKACELILEGKTLGQKMMLMKQLGSVELGNNDVKIKEFTDLIGKIQDLINKRNIAVHGNWRIAGPIQVADVASGKAIGKMVSTNLRHAKTQKLKANELETLGDQFDDQSSVLIMFWLEFWSSQSPHQIPALEGGIGT